MFRYVNLNSDSNTNSQPINKKNQKALPISLLSGGNTFFVKIKSSQIASNYNDTSNKIKPTLQQKINSTYFNKDNKNKSYNKYLINSQNKNYIFRINNSIEYNTNTNNTKKSIVNKSKQDLFNKGIYSFTSMKHNDSKNNKTSININSFRQNYNGVLLTDVELLKKNMNKNFNKFEENKKIIKEKNEKNTNTLNYKLNKKIIATKNKYNNNNIVYDSSMNNKIKPSNDKNIVLTAKNKNANNNNQIKLYKKNQYIMKNNNIRNTNRNNLGNTNLTNILSNNNSSIEKPKFKNSKNSCSEGKNKIIQGQKKNKLICYKELSNNNNNIFKDRFIETEELNSSISKKKAGKRIKSINIKPNNENYRIQKNANNSKSNFNTINNNNKSLLLQKKLFEKNKAQDINSKNNNNNNRKNKQIFNSFISGEIFNKLNNTLTELIEPNSNNYKNRKNQQINHNHNDNKKDIKMGKKYLLSDLDTYTLDKIKINNYPNIIINNNYLYNYMPLVTLNNSVNDKNVKRLSLNRNPFIENKVDNQNFNTNNSQNFQIDRAQTYILNYNSFVEKNSKGLNNNTLDNDNKNKKYKNESKQNLIENNTKNNLDIKNNNKYNFNHKFINSYTLDNINRTNRNDFYIGPNRANSNNIAENYVSKEKIKNQPLNKNPKKLNILSLIQENNRKIKDTNNRGQNQFHSFVEKDNFNKCYNNKNVYETIDYILYPENYKIKHDIEVLDNFDDMNTIIRRINFENVDLKTTNIFTVNDSNNLKKKIDNYWYAKFSESFNNLFDKKFLNQKNNLSATQNKIKNNHNIYHSRQSGSTKDSNKENSSIKKYRVFSYLDKKIENN